MKKNIIFKISKISLTNLILFLLIFMNLGVGFAQNQDKPEKPKLVVLIAIDAFRYDYLTRFNEHFGEKGFNYFLSNGAIFNNAHVTHFRTVTAPGHATMLTGSSGAINGIIENKWWDRTLKKNISCVADSNVSLFTGNNSDIDKEADGTSPINIAGSTVGDELKLASNFKSKVIGLSFKDRGAILPVGKLANGAYWYNTTNGKFISSSYYFIELPLWVQNFNNKNIPDKYFKKKWDRLLDEKAYSNLRIDNYKHELDMYGLGKTFPHPIGSTGKLDKSFYKSFGYTPYSDKILSELAKSAIIGENLGGDATTDLLTISFSATDRVGHHYGTYSHEMMDQIVRLDRTVEDLVKFIDKEVGLDNTILILTADHGGPAIPEYAKQLKFDAGRIDTTAVPKGLGSIIIPNTITSALNKKFGKADWIDTFIPPNIYLNYETIKEKNLNNEEVELSAKESLRETEGIEVVFTRSEIMSDNLQNTKVFSMVKNQFHSKRSGNLVVVNKPYYETAGFRYTLDQGSHHETYANFNTHIPIIFCGKQFNKGYFSNNVSLNDIAITLSTILGISNPSGNQGSVLNESLK